MLYCPSKVTFLLGEKVTLLLWAYMFASKTMNSFGLSRPLGMTGPEDMNKVSKNVYAVDCDDFNNTFDDSAGHKYFLGKNGDLNTPSPIIQHMATALKTRRVNPPERDYRLK